MMNFGLEAVARTLTVVSRRRGSAASAPLLRADPLPPAAFPCLWTKVAVINVDTAGKGVSGQKGICVQWR
jgi:hypothetical protein